MLDEAPLPFCLNRLYGLQINSERRRERGERKGTEKQQLMKGGIEHTRKDVSRWG